jgi:hypothetical protein
LNDDNGEKSVKGLWFERLGTHRHYNVVFHMGNSYLPVSEETLEELKAQSLLSVERFLDPLIDRVGHSSYLKDQIRADCNHPAIPWRRSPGFMVPIREL